MTDATKNAIATIDNLFSFLTKEEKREVAAYVIRKIPVNDTMRAMRASLSDELLVVVFDELESYFDQEDFGGAYNGIFKKDDIPKLSDLEYSLLLAIDVEAEDKRDYVPMERALFHFASLNVALNVVDSCVNKRLVVTRELNKVDCIALTELGIEHVRKRKQELNHVPHIPYT